MYLLILFLPFISFLYTALLGRMIGKRFSLVLCLLLISISYMLVLFVFYEIILSNSVVSLSVFNWVCLGLFDITLGLYFDFLTCAMLVVIMSISFFVHLYSIGYMSHDLYILRFMSYLSLFTFFMLFMVTSDNLLQLFIGWEGVGLCSYLLINFWYSRILANKAALKAMIMNRISDVLFILGILLLLLDCRTTDFLIIFNLVDFIWFDPICFLGLYIFKLDIICFFFFIGAVGKSAQIGLHTWLPDAMEGPTPVSALLHAATMVTAGVFLIIRMSPLLEFSSFVLSLISIIGAITAFFSALVGIFQYDIKKLIAFSTCSQLGYMFFSCGFSGYHVAIFHLFNHAFFKALLFLGAGSIIHALFDEQDMRKMGRLLNFIPFTYFSIFVGSVAIMGFPFLTGFYSKDLLLELSYVRLLIDASFVYSFGIFTAFFTAVYSLKFLLFVFFYNMNGFRQVISSMEDSLYIYISLTSLSVFSIFCGYIFCDIFVGFGFSFLQDSLFFFNYDLLFIDIELLNPVIKNIPFIFSCLGLCLGFVLFYFGQIFLFYYSFLNFMFLLKYLLNLKMFFFFFGYFNVIYNYFFLVFFSLSYINYNKFIDKGFLEFFGPFGFYKFFRYSSRIFSKLQMYQVFFIIALMFFSLIVFFLILILHVKFFFVVSNNVSLFLISLFFVYSMVKKNIKI